MRSLNLIVVGLVGVAIAALAHGCGALAPPVDAASQVPPLAVSVLGPSTTTASSQAVLSAIVTGGVPPLSFMWGQVWGPPTDTPDPLNSELSVTFTTAGAHIFRVTVTDALGITAEADHTVTVEPQRHTLLISGQGQGSVEPAGGDYDQGAQVLLTATPTDGWHFDHWEGDASGRQPQFTLLMDGPKTVTAVFVDEVDSNAPDAFTPDVEAISAATWGVATMVDTETGPLFFVLGTSFAVDATRLVTNAHVIDGVLETARELGSQAQYVVVQHETGAYFEIDRMWKHPDYDPDQPISTPDVGVIAVQGPLPTQVALADDDAVRALSVLDEVALCGFPGDVTALDIALGSTRPRATCLTGTITALRPFDPNQPAAPANTFLIQHDIQTSGGTSGSAMFDAAGYVVGINNAATTDETASNRFGIRVDLARALLDDIDAGRVTALTININPSGAGQPVPQVTCPPTAYRNAEFGFGINIPGEADGPRGAVEPGAVLTLVWLMPAPGGEYWIVVFDNAAGLRPRHRML